MSLKNNKILLNLINKGFFPLQDSILAFMPAYIRIKFGAYKFIRSYNPMRTKSKATISKKIKIDVFDAPNKSIEKMKILLKNHLRDNLIGAYIHGSLGTYEEIPYSDFDALVIIKDEVLHNPKRLAYTAQKLNQALKIMYEFDPLQHHGWFVLTESDLLNYPQTYFPYEIFQYSKSLFKDMGTEIKIFDIKQDIDYIFPFINLADSIIKKIESRKYPSNMYQLKGLLSQFMLLPTLYMQAKEKRGIFKKLSFDLAKQDFDPTEWQIMEQVSEIRSNWHYKMTPLQRKLLTINHPILRKIIVKYFAPTIPQDIKNKLDNNFYNQMLDLCLLFKKVFTDA